MNVKFHPMKFVARHSDDARRVINRCTREGYEMTVDMVESIRRKQITRRAAKFRPKEVPAVERLAYQRQIASARIERDRALEASLRAAAAREACAATVRKTLLAAARVARKLGFAVRSSKGRDGTISSYYLQRRDGRPIRISDHQIPATAHRDMIASFNGYGIYDGYPGPELIIDCERSTTWLRRAIILTAAGRVVPGAE